MRDPLKCWQRLTAVTWAALFILAGNCGVRAQTVVPGAGQKVTSVGDDFEDEKWTYYLNSPKSSHNLDEEIRSPGGVSANGRWYESAKRGQPDVVRRVETPIGGLPGSKGALLLRSQHTGVPGRRTDKVQQDDLLVNINNRLGHNISVAMTPNFVVRVYLPPFEYWENRSGNTFAVRAGCFTTKTETSAGFLFLPGRTTSKQEEYWPGMFIHFNSETDPQNKKDSAHILVRAGPRGYDFKGPDITETGWWTFGMSFTPDGRVHYYASPGVDKLTAKDHITSQYPYGYRCEQFQTFFFNVVNHDDGRTWSTPWIIDDPEFFIIGSRTASRSQARPFFALTPSPAKASPSRWRRDGLKAPHSDNSPNQPPPLDSPRSQMLDLESRTAVFAFAGLFGARLPQMKAWHDNALAGC